MEGQFSNFINEVSIKQKWRMSGVTHVGLGKIVIRKRFNRSSLNVWNTILIRSTA